MKHILITYGDSGYEAAKTKIAQAAKITGEFDEIYSLGREDLSKKLLSSDVIKIHRGGGLWSWKPDVILTAMDRVIDGDIIVYCDAGCTIYQSKEWSRYWKKLSSHDIIAQRIFQRTDQWTRTELLEHFASNGVRWQKCYQNLATVVILKVTPFTRSFIQEWRDLIIDNPRLIMDVTEEERPMQHASLIENRHDQAVFSSLIYKYLANSETREKIYTQWEHIEDLDPFCKQAIRATRLRQGEQETVNRRRTAVIKRIIKDYCFKPFYYAPLQWWYSR